MPQLSNYTVKQNPVNLNPDKQVPIHKSTTQTKLQTSISQNTQRLQPGDHVILFVLLSGLQEASVSLELLRRVFRALPSRVRCFFGLSDVGSSLN